MRRLLPLRKIRSLEAAVQAVWGRARIAWDLVKLVRPAIRLRPGMRYTFWSTLHNYLVFCTVGGVMPRRVVIDLEMSLGLRFRCRGVAGGWNQAASAVGTNSSGLVRTPLPPTTAYKKKVHWHLVS
jgi:hypothetical protein